MQSHPNIHEIPIQNVSNGGWEQAPSHHTFLEHQGWGQLVRTPVNQWSNTSPKSQSESSHLENIQHKSPAPKTILKVAHAAIPNAIFATNVVVVPPTENHQSILDVDSPSPTHNKPIDLEHSSHKDMYVGKKIKGKETTSGAHLESLAVRITIIDEDIFPEIAMHSTKFSYRFGLPICSHVFLGSMLTSYPKSNMILFTSKYPIDAMNLNSLFVCFLHTTFLVCHAYQRALVLARILVVDLARIDLTTYAVYAMYFILYQPQTTLKNKLT